MKRSIVGLLGFLASTVLATSVAHAAVVTFAAGDPNANSTDPRPISNTTAAAFDTAAGALGAVNLINFESAPLGTYTSLLIAPGVTLTGIDFFGNASGQSIRNVPLGTPDRLFGYNTTAAGSRFAQFNGGSLTFTFATPVSAFGGFLSGIGLDGETIKFSDGTSQTINLLNFGINTGGVEFVGFTDAGKLISSITITVGQDAVVIDDLRYVTPRVAAVPEPSIALLIGLGALALTASRKRKQR